MRYMKSAMQVIGTVVAAIAAVLASGHALTPVQWVNVAIAGVGACLVFAAPNVPGAMYTKTIVSALMAVLSFLATVIVPCTTFSQCHVSTADWLQMAIIALTTLGVYTVPNKTTEARSANP